MPFITQGKANIKYLLIVVLIAAVAGGLIFIYWNIYQKEIVSLNNFTEIKNSKKIINSETTDWTGPVIGGWSGVITSIDKSNKTIKAITMPGRTPKITLSYSNNTIVKDDSSNALNLNNLKTGDVISVSGTYQMRGKYTENWEVRINETNEIILVGGCIEEGKELNLAIQDNQCCTDLTLIAQKYCTKCGDGICTPPENKDSCPLDCTIVGATTSVSMSINAASFDLNNKTFSGGTKPERKNIKVLTADSTRFTVYSYVEGGVLEVINSYTFSEFYSVIKNWTGFNPGFRVNGILEKEGVIKASEVFYYVQ